MLIVMAVVVVLAAAAMPSIANQIESAREANDIDAIRTAYSQAYTAAYLDLMNGGDVKADGYAVSVTLTQKTDGWQGNAPKIGGATLPTAVIGTSKDNNTVTFKFEANSAKDGISIKTDGGIVFSKADASATPTG